MWKLALVQAITLGLIVLPQLMSGRNRRLTLLFAACIAFPLVLALAKRFGNPRLGSVQVILGPQGVSQVDTFDKSSALGVIDRWGGMLGIAAILTVMLLAMPNGFNRFTVGAMAFIAVVATVGVLVRRRGRVKARRADGQSVNFIPWSKVGEVDLRPVDNDRWNLRLATPGTFFRAVREHVNADVFIDPAPAAKLGLRIQRWRGAVSS